MITIKNYNWQLWRNWLLILVNIPEKERISINNSLLMRYMHWKIKKTFFQSELKMNHRI